MYKIQLNLNYIGCNKKKVCTVRKQQTTQQQYNANQVNDRDIKIIITI